MSSILLSILIPTVVGREEQFKLLYARLSYQYQGSEVEIFHIKDDKEITIGEKREMLYKGANGLFSWQIDDDDSIAPNAIELILNAIRSNPDVDVISFEEYVNMDGVEYKSNHSNDYHDWEGDGNSLFPDGFHFHRTIFFKDVIRTELAKSVPVPKLRWAEDHEWAKLLKPLIKSDHHIQKQIYRYIHISSNPEERYGLNK